MADRQTTTLFTDHSRSWQSNLYVYPVVSRRSRGVSIGVNLNPDKVCNFDCIYCCVDRKVPGTVRTVDLGLLEQELRVMLPLVLSGSLFASSPFDQTPLALRRLNDVAFSGDGEPTSCVFFPEAVDLVVSLLAELGASSVKPIVITNATLFDRPRVIRGLEAIRRSGGEVWAKLDAGTQEYYATVDRSSIPLSRVLANILAESLRGPVVIQSLFMNVDGQPPSGEEIAAFVDRLCHIRERGGQVSRVQVYTIARQAAEACATPLSAPAVDAIADRVRAAGFHAEAFYGPD